jgi:bile acid-coenzyme A ligase
VTSLAEPVGTQLARLAVADPERVVVRVVARDGAESTLTTQQLADRSDALAHWLRGAGAGPGQRVVSTLGSSWQHYVAALATWKTGACFVPLNPASPPPELQSLLALADPVVHLTELPDLSADLGPLEPVVSDPGLALATGGSTGTPKLVATAGPWGALPWDFLGGIGFRTGMTQLVSGPLHHNGPFVMSYYGLLLGHSLVVMERFDAGLALDLVQRHQVEAAFLVPTTMHRLLDEWRRAPRDLSSLTAVVHSSAPCPEWLKRAWIELVGAEHVYEGYGASEGVGGAHVRGDVWLQRPGTVGKPYCELRVLRADGTPAAAGEVGELFLRRHADGRSTYAYVGAPSATATDDGFVSVGDLGRLDEDGYLYLADRRGDLIITGGVNVYPAEVEAALTSAPGVADAVVVGVPDEEWGERVHAVVQPRDADAPPDVADLTAHCKGLLSPYKVPKSFVFVAQLPRTEAGKVRRADLRRAVVETG